MSALEQERLARLALSRLAEPGDPRLGAVVAEIGPCGVRDHLLAERDLQGLRTDVAQRLAAVDPARDLDLAQRRGFRFVVPGDAEWPVGLDDLAAVAPLHQRGGPPLGLWVRGPLRLDDTAGALAMVGSRSATTYGADVAGEMAARMAQAGVPVVSGAAFGIDQAAHRGALAGDGPTVAVLACGIDRVYPAAHRALVDHIADVGAVVSEVPLGWSPMKLRFLARNRLIAGLARGTVVVEAALRSGALSTANWAGRLNRAVMGVPGPVTSATSQGVHELIRSGAATLVTGAADALELIGRAGEHLVEERRGELRPRDRLSLRDQQVLDAVPVVQAAATDAIARTAGVGLAEVADALARLTRAGHVQHTGLGWRLAADEPA